MKLYRTASGIFAEEGSCFYPVSASGWDELIRSADLHALVRAATSGSPASTHGGVQGEEAHLARGSVVGRCLCEVALGA